MINTIRQAAMRHINLADMVKYWKKATEKERLSWMLPLKVAQAIEPEYVPDDNVAAVMAAIGYGQISIILVDDMLDNEAGGGVSRNGCGPGRQHGAYFSELGYVVDQPP